MKKALLMGVSGAALVLAVSAAQAGDNTIIAGQASFEGQGQGQGQGQGIDADGGNGGSGGDSVAIAATTGPGNDDAFADSAPGGNGGRGGDALAAGRQNQRQSQSQRTQQILAIRTSDDDSSHGEGTTVDGNNNTVTSHSATATGSGMAAAFGGRNVTATGNGVAAGNDAVYMHNDTTMTGTNNQGAIVLSTGNANGGDGYGGHAANFGYNDASNWGYAGSASAYNKDTYAGDAKSAAVSANLSSQYNDSYQKSTGGDAGAASGALAAGAGFNFGAAGALAADVLGAQVPVNVNPAVGFAPGAGNDDANADARGLSLANSDQRSRADADNRSTNLVADRADSWAKAHAGDGGDNKAHQSNDATQKSAALSAAKGGDATAVSKAYGGDNLQAAKAMQSQKAVGGDGYGGNGGTNKAVLSTGGMGNLNMSGQGISTVSLNSGIGANALNSFSINANASFR